MCASKRCAAAARLGEKGIHIRGDIINLALKDAVVDGSVSLHTVYHVPAERQILAFRKLERVTRGSGSGVVVYSWGDYSRGTKMRASLRAAAELSARLRTLLRPLVPDTLVRMLRRGELAASAVPHVTMEYSASQFCFHAFDIKWWRRNLAASGQWTLTVWRSVSVQFLKSSVPDNAFGRLLLVFVYNLERMFPKALGRIGQYPMFVFNKPRSSTN
jgi:hypothetical protein